MGNTEQSNRNLTNTRLVKILAISALAWVITMLVIAGCAVAFTFNRMKNADAVTQAQIKVYGAQAENVGKPQIIEQRYFSPQNNK